MLKTESSFFDSLCEHDEFTRALGKMVLSSAKFESSLKGFMDAKGKVTINNKSPLGDLLKKLIENHTLDRGATEHFGCILRQRNYFVHKLHESLADYPENEFELQRFVNRANGLAEEMEFFCKLITEATYKSGA